MALAVALVITGTGAGADPAVALQDTADSWLPPGMQRLQGVMPDTTNAVNIVRIAADAPVDLRVVAANGRARVSQLCQEVQCLIGVNGGPFDIHTGEPIGTIIVDALTRHTGAATGQVSIGSDGRLNFGIVPGALQALSSFYRVMHAGVLVHLRNEPLVAWAKPRTLVCWDDANNRWLATIDGNRNGVKGVSMPAAALILKAAGATECVSLDGGGSTTFVANGHTVNVPSDAGGERYVANALVVTLKPSYVPPPPPPVTTTTAPPPTTTTTAVPAIVAAPQALPPLLPISHSSGFGVMGILATLLMLSMCGYLARAKWRQMLAQY